MKINSQVIPSHVSHDKEALISSNTKSRINPQHVVEYLQKNQDKYTAWRHDLHAHPETAFEEYRTATFVADTLRSFHLDVHTGLAKTGVVAVLSIGKIENCLNANNSFVSSSMDHKTPLNENSDPLPMRRIGIRADLDALPIHERNNLEYCSKYEGKMHACGHDGHVVILLAAAEYLSKYRSVWDDLPASEIVFIFQPAEENVAGGRVMVEEGLFDHFPVDEVYALHNLPGLPQGSLHTTVGPQMASADFFQVQLHGQGGHAAWPQHCDDLIVYASQCIQQWQSLVSRCISPLDTVVLSVTQIHAGESLNALPAHLQLGGTVRCLNESVRQKIETHMQKILAAICQGAGITYTWDYDARYPVTFNQEHTTQKALQAASECMLIDSIESQADPLMGAEDFAWMLRSKPGTYVLLGAGDTPMLHHNQYNFNDELITIGASYWIHLCDVFFKKN